MRKLKKSHNNAAKNGAIQYLILLLLIRIVTINSKGITTKIETISVSIKSIEITPSSLPQTASVKKHSYF
ncbi:hypothetical protein R8G64_01660 [Tenacibaculum maritimum]|uniref:hypothetical protein n=1 Tax=Tenacibaculum maritimum TaxID=107401 RepID=UPI00133051B2|nr:hypothetical protein [Tenacibaculum maritimum]